MKKIVGFIGVVMIIAAFVAGFIAYFVYSFDPQTGTGYDGFGRKLSKSPLFMRLIFGQDRLWPGWFWFGADLVIFWGSLGIAYTLVSWGFKLKE